MQQSRPGLGALYMIGAGVCFATMGALVKLISADMSNSMIVFLRNLFALLIIGPWLLRSGRIHLRTTALHWHLLRAGVGLTAMSCFFWAIPRLHLAEAVLLNYSQPLFIPFIAWAWLGERPPRAVYPAVMIGFVGVALILKPGAGLVSAAGVVGLLAGVLAAVAMVTIRRLSASEPAALIVFYYALFATVFAALPLAWTWETPNAAQWALLATTGIVGTGGQMLLTRAYSLAPAARVGSLIYSAVVFAGLYGWLFWGESLDVYTLLGIALVVIAGVLAIHQRKPRSHRRRIA